MTSELLKAPRKRLTPELRAQPQVKTARAPEVDPLLHAFHPSRLRWSNVDWVVAVWIAGMHLGCVAALFFVSWQAVAVAVGLHWLTCSIGICLGYHRFLSHCSLKLRWPARAFVSLCGVLSGEGTPLTWSANHRIHHARSDKEGDPHSPNDGSWWSHIMWLFIHRNPAETEALQQRYVPDLLQDPVLRFFERTYGLWLIGSGVVLFAIGGWPFLLWGLCVRMVFAYHSTWFVNSATHMWGYRNYETTDRSRNLWWVAILAYGEGWHNNHHAFPRLARAGHRWWEFDATFCAIRVLRAVGLAYEVDDRVPEDGKLPAPAKP
jgi:stearoyl-CoA desaturase (delta-9 desaturase)